MCKVRFQHTATQNSVVKWQVLYKRNEQYIPSKTKCEIENNQYIIKPLDIDDLEEDIPVVVIWDEYIKKDKKCLLNKTVEMYHIKKGSMDTVIKGCSENNRDEYENIQIIKKEKNGYSYSMPSINFFEVRKTYKAALVQAIIPDSGLIAPLLYKIDEEQALDTFGFYDEKKIDRACVIIRESCADE